MGQYYKPLLEAENGDRIVIDNYLDGNYYVAKLMEHSWFQNDFVLAVASLLYGTKKKLAWVGDYADSDKDNFPKIPVTELHEEVWKSEVTFKELKTTDFSLSGKYFVNHTLKEYIDLDKYFNENVIDGWCINPVPLLTAIGNGLGGGDFDGDKEQVENVGKWAWDTLEITDEPPKKYKEVMYHFIEE